MLEFWAGLCFNLSCFDNKYVVYNHSQWVHTITCCPVASTTQTLKTTFCQRAHLPVTQLNKIKKIT